MKWSHDNHMTEKSKESKVKRKWGSIHNMSSGLSQYRWCLLKLLSQIRWCLCCVASIPIVLSLCCLWYLMSALTISSCSQSLYMLNIVIVPQISLMRSAMMSPDGSSICSQLSVSISLLTRLTNCIFSGCFSCVDGYIGVQSLEAINMLRKLIEGSCSTTMLMLCSTSLLLLMSQCWLFGVLLRFCCQIASAFHSLLALYRFIFYVLGVHLLMNCCEHPHTVCHSFHIPHCPHVLGVHHLALLPGWLSYWQSFPWPLDLSCCCCYCWGVCFSCQLGRLGVGTLYG